MALKVKGIDMFFDTTNSNLRSLKTWIEGFSANPRFPFPIPNKVEYDKSRKCVTIWWDEVEWSPSELIHKLAEARSVGESIERVVFQDYGDKFNFTGSEFYVQPDTDRATYIEDVEQALQVEKDNQKLNDFLDGKANE